MPTLWEWIPLISSGGIGIGLISLAYYFATITS